MNKTITKVIAAALTACMVAMVCGAAEESSSASGTSRSDNGYTKYKYEEDVKNKGTAAWTVWVPDKDERTEITNAVIRLTNEHREDNGLEPLEKKSTLSKGGTIRAQEQAVSFGHTRPDGSNWSTIAKDVDFKGTSVGENCLKLSRNFFTRDEGNADQVAELLMEMWKNSPSHNANMLEEKFTQIGVGVFVAKSGQETNYYCVQLFGC